MRTQPDGSIDKDDEDHFRDWETEFFGVGYGTGELPVLTALRTFLELCHPTEHGFPIYDHEELSHALTPATAWLLITILSKRAEAITWGTSSRYGFLTEEGERLRDFVLARSPEELAALTVYPDGYVECGPAHCNCGPRGYTPMKRCHNPFWKERSSYRKI